MFFECSHSILDKITQCTPLGILKEWLKVLQFLASGTHEVHNALEAKVPQKNDECPTQPIKNLCVLIGTKLKKGASSYKLFFLSKKGGDSISQA